VDLFDFRALGAVFGFPLNPLVDHTVAALGTTALSVDAKRNAELVLVQTHDDWILNQRNGAPRGGGSAEH